MRKPMKRFFLSLVAAFALLACGLAPAQVSVDASKVGLAGRYIGEFTWAQLYALTTMRAGDEAIVTDIPAGGGRSKWYYDATGARWRVYAPTLIAENNNLLTAAVGQTADQYIGTGLSAPVGILKGAVFVLRTGFGKDGTTDAYGSATILHIGTAGTTADTAVTTQNLSTALGAAQRSYGSEFWYRMASATSVQRLGAGGSGAQGSFTSAGQAIAPNAAVTITDVTTNALVLGWSTTMGGATNKSQLTYQALILLP